MKENLSKNNLKQQYASTEWVLQQICATINCEVYPIINLFTKVAHIITISSAWLERGGSAIKCFKTNKRSTLKNDALNALLIIPLNGPQLRTLEAK